MQATLPSVQLWCGVEADVIEMCRPLRQWQADIGCVLLI
jgi:hypothetical protein